MSGHSKWTQIKHKKALTDSRKSKIFTKLVKMISVAVKEKGEDPAMNPTLRTAIEKAKEANMPKENIDRAIKHASGEKLEELTLEAYGPHGVALVIETITDSHNRTVNEIKHILSEHGGKLAEPGSVKWSFDFKNREYIPKFALTLGEKERAELEALFEALDEHDDIKEIFSNLA